MKILLWAELQKLRRSNILFVTIFAVFFVAILVFSGGVVMVSEEQYALNRTGWYLSTVQVWATLFVLPAMLALFGSYLICREEQDDTMKSLLLIPVSKRKLTAVKLLVTFVFGIFIYLLLFLLTFSVEIILHTSEVSFTMFFHFLNMYLLEGIGVFLAVSPIIALVPYWRKSYWLAMVLAELYSFAGLFMSMSPVLKTFYPISAIFGVSGYYETSPEGRFCSLLVLLLCGGVFLLFLQRTKGLH